jgi:hypothetical protein
MLPWLMPTIPALESLDNPLPTANRPYRHCDPPGKHKNAPTPASLAANGIGAETIGHEASSQTLFTTLHPFQSIGQLAVAIVARLALGGAA